ncbi:tetratricopeptide repeat protein [Kaarinaea lacus]
MITKHHIIVISLLIFLIPLSGYAEKLENLSEAQAAFDIGEYEKAVNLWRTAAFKGNSNAQVLMGLAFANGWGVDKDMRSAEMWYHIAAENNNPSGQFLLGLYYLSSKTDLLEAGFMWLKRSAENGDVSAQGFLKKAEEKHWFENIDRWNLAGQKLAAVR